MNRMWGHYYQKKSVGYYNSHIENSYGWSKKDTDRIWCEFEFHDCEQISFEIGGKAAY